MARSKLLVPPRRSPDGVTHRITPESAGWTYVGFEARVIDKNRPATLETGNREICVVVLSGTARVTTAGFDSGPIGERADVF
jgi:5-deoxy-glucuronate isomerase